MCQDNARKDKVLLVNKGEQDPTPLASLLKVQNGRT